MAFGPYRPTIGWGRVVCLVGILLAGPSNLRAQTSPTAESPPGTSRGEAMRPAASAVPTAGRTVRPDPKAGRPTATPKPTRTSPTAAPADPMEERLRRMEEAYLRMERNNQKIQAQYDALLHKYEDLSTKVMNEARAGDANGSRARTVSRTTSTGANGERMAIPAGEAVDGTAEAGQPPVDLLPLIPGASPEQDRGTGAQGTGGRTGIAEQPQMLPTADEGEPFRSRMDRIGAGAEGTDGRVSPSQQPAATGGSEGRAGRTGDEASGVEVGGKGKEGGEKESENASGVDLKPKRHPGKIAFGEGLEFTSDDGEFKLQFHNLTQGEFRGFDDHDLGVLKDQFFIPRQRWYFVGTLTKNVEFYTVINRGYGSLDLLDAFITLRYNDALRFRIGRMKTPYLYEYFQIAEGDLIAPERSIYAGNMALNRQDGFMFLGDLFKNQLSYATGLYNGPRRSFENLDSAVDNVGTVTWRPFLLSERFKALKYFNVGGSWDWGYQDNSPPQPVYFETANDQTSSNGATSLSPTFLTLNSNVRELGERTQWGAHAVWYYKSFFLLGEYGGAREGFGLTTTNNSVPVNVSGWNVTTSYFLTGEQVTRRVNMVQPLRDFNFNFLKPGEKFSPGAVEVYARYSTMDIGRNIFTSGFADPNLWTNHVWATDIGLNWYLNFYTRIYLDWQHAGYGNEIVVGSGKFASTTDIYWLRFQVFF